MIRHVSSTPSWRVKRTLWPIIAACSSTSYGRGALAALSANSMSSVIGSGAAVVGATRVEDHPDPGRRVELDHQLVRFGSPLEQRRSRAVAGA